MFININNEDLLVELKSNYKVSSYYDNEGYIQLYFDIVLTDDDDNIKNKIGFLNIIVVKKNNIDTIIENLDGISQEMYDFAFFIKENKNLNNHLNFMEKYNFSYIEKIFIESEYRNKNIGSSILKYLEDYLSFFNINNLYLCSYPIDCFKNKQLNKFEEQKKIDKFYYKNNFKLLEQNKKYNQKFMHKFIK